MLGARARGLFLEWCAALFGVISALEAPGEGTNVRFLVSLVEGISMGLRHELEVMFGQLREHVEGLRKLDAKESLSEWK
eukprot:9164034-Pyramimonas_sp.AAC.1